MGVVHVNLVDLIDALRAGRRPRTFKNSQKLQAYTLESRDRFFPMQAAKKDGFARLFLRVMPRE